ncbi:protein kinase-like protein [Roseibium hamelinense]|uniref:Protein kinase-like protein n=1 Tax=Roseibium hamelinense TaxID=150831 RepID=A0A562SE25_9HYPH|nr:serine/threonine-protein kinase [Roseibium hamelinense]MTI42566.1 serine/threonine protein kinase [Roseibium hamelinense]TWI79555.1 protein kinase-like protein [Roseibium hamelinense]
MALKIDPRAYGFHPEKCTGLPDGPPSPGWVLKSRFLLLKEIGSGGQSQVFKAMDLVARKAGLSTAIVAIKLMVAGEDVDPDFISLMHREARRLRDLVHPNIVRVYDMDRTGPVHFMVMEFLEGRTLSALLRESPERKLPPNHVERLVQDIGSALSFAHGKGIVHSDLKPGNIFLESSGAVKLIDFNIACPIARSIRTSEEDTLRILIRTGAITPAYASPQRLQGAEPCEADDVFSFALLTYLMLAGVRPFGPKNALEALEANATPGRINSVNDAQWRTICSGLALNDHDRTTTVREFVDGFSSANKQSLGRAWLPSWFRPV